MPRHDFIHRHSRATGLSKMTIASKGAVLLTVLALAACTGTAGSDSRDVTAAECRAYYEYTYRLDGMDAGKVLGEDQLAKDSATCAETGMVTRRHFDCAMAAESVGALQGCGVPNT